MSAKDRGKFCFAFIPARAVFVFLTFLGICLAYAFKGVLSVAIVAMVKHENTTESNGHECREEIDSHQNKYSKGEFDWDDHQQALILGAFFYGYIIFQLPAGVLSEKFGAKWIFGSSILISSILSLLGPVAARLGFIPFFLIRFGQGLVEGVTIPCMNAMIARWMPKMERSRATSVILSGSSIGTVVAMPLTGYLCDGAFMGGWPAIFYVLGITGCVWFVFWAFFHFDAPESHPYISQNEINLIRDGQGNEKTSKNRNIPWKSIFTSIPVYALCITHFGQGWGFLTVLQLLPLYLTKILHMDIKTNGMISSLPYIAQAVTSWIASYISDKIRQKGLASVTLIRKVNNSIAYFGPALCMIAVVLSKCNTNSSIIFFIIAMGLNGCCYSGVNSNHVDMAPDFAATLMGITNTIGNFPGFIAPSIAAIFYSRGQTLSNWSYVFYIPAGVFIFTNTVYILFSTAQLQSWGVNRSEDLKKKELENI